MPILVYLPDLPTVGQQDDAMQLGNARSVFHVAGFVSQCVDCTWNSNMNMTPLLQVAETIMRIVKM